MQSERPPQIYTINSIRVIAEYFVVRHHCLPDHHFADEVNMNILGPIGEDILSFFFVLCGFVSMYSAEHSDFSTWDAKVEWALKKPSRIYPIFLLNYLCCLPVTVLVWMPEMQYCWAGYVCSFLQLFFLDAWAGCGFHFPVLGVGWFISCAVWLWMAFPFIKDFLVGRVFSGGRIWTKMILINIIWSLGCLLLWNYDIYTVAPFPPMRAGEFLIGCGTAFTLQTKTPWIIANGRYMIFFFIVIGIYIFQLTKHNLIFLCMHETSQHEECNLWQAGQKWMPASPPCVTILEKVVNKYALVWAVVIHGLARAELDGKKDGFISRFLHAEIFQTLNRFALTLYLSHISIGYAFRWLGYQLFGFNINSWRDDILLFLVYLSCYLLHCTMECVKSKFKKKTIIIIHQEIGHEIETLLEK
jgi:peptidoglycan/LPS O-acetylase OafA/YrhL